MVEEHHSTSSEGAYSTDELHSVLESENRRLVLRFFQDREQVVATLDELADYLAAQEDGVRDFDRAKIILHHTALPKLAGTGALEYDSRTRMTRFRGHVRLESLLPDVSVA